MKAAISARVSTTDQDCEVQLLELREFVQRRGWSIRKEFVDTGFSGAKARRPAPDRLMADAAQRRFDVVLVYKLDRFGRSVLHLNQQIDARDSHEIRFYCDLPRVGHPQIERNQPVVAPGSRRRRPIRM